MLPGSKFRNLTNPNNRAVSIGIRAPGSACKDCTVGREALSRLMAEVLIDVI